MRSPWVGSLALLAPAHGFVAQSAVGRGGTSMLQAFVRPQAAGLRTAASSRGWGHEGLRLQRAAPRAVSAAAGTRMMTGGAGGDGTKAKKEKVKKPESYYKKTVILPQTAFEQVRFVLLCMTHLCCYAVCSVLCLRLIMSVCLFPALLLSSDKQRSMQPWCSSCRSTHV